MSASESSAETRVAQHYATEKLDERLFAAFAAVGKSKSAITLDDLAAVDEFHIGGREATEAIAAQMNLRPGMKLLDIGCGIGGSARYFSSAHGCAVTGIDLTAEYVRTARVLSEVVGMDGQVRFQTGSALDLPFEAASFDGAYMFHVGMNLADKTQLFREVLRMLRPGAVFAIYDVMRSGDGEFPFPVPWASTQSESFVAPVAEYREGLGHEGFQFVAERERREFAIEFFDRMRKRTEQQGPHPLGVQIVMGELAMAKIGNLVEALKRGVLSPVELLVRC
jgi:ubiquinone/menaquinone biosynthesis C-methylase UbiE